MKFVLLANVLLASFSPFLLVANETNQTGTLTPGSNSTSGLQLGIDFTKTNFFIDEPIRIAIVLSNLNQTPKTVPTAVIEGGLFLTVIDAENRLVRPNEAWLGEQFSEPSSVMLPPQGRTDTMASLHQLYKLAAGTYRIAARREMSLHPPFGRTFVTSDFIAITITEGQPYPFFVTDELATHHLDSNVFTPEAVERARHARESRPAAEDPEGNWGDPTEGRQLSIRFDKVAFTNGEPINAWVIVRNVSGKFLWHEVLKLGGRPDFTFTLVCAGTNIPPIGSIPVTGTNFVDRLRSLRQGSFGGRPSPPGTQRKYLINIGQNFEVLQPGEYAVQAVLQVPKLDGTSPVDLTSGKASFKIVEAVESASPAKPNEPK